jgi:2-oxoglutarate ferredoxin oxidoreductase subunit beta
MGSIDFPFNPVSLALGAEATFVARTIDMDRKHMAEVLGATAAHRGTSFVEIYQNCNVFNDKAFIELTSRETRDDNRVYLEHGKPIVFGPDDEYGIRIGELGAEIVEVSAVGIDAIQVHNAKDPEPGVAFALSRLSQGPHGPTPLGIFRDVDRAVYEDLMVGHIDQAQEKRGTGDLAALLRSGGSWTAE